jgi:hypothetical protein
MRGGTKSYDSVHILIRITLLNLWAQMKWEFAQKNKMFKISGMERLVNEEREKVTQTCWASCVHLAVKLQ